MSSISAAHRSLLVKFAVPLPVPRVPITVFAPHPDDETIGAGGLIAAARRANVDVEVVIATDGAASHDVVGLAELRRAEAIAACDRLGVDEGSIRFLDFPDQGLAGARPDLDHELALLPMTPIVVGPLAIDANPDHRALGHAIAHRLRDAPGVQYLEYPVWLWQRWAWMTPGRTRVARGIELASGPFRQFRHYRTRTLSLGPDLATKRHALEAHRSQVYGIDGGASIPTGTLDLLVSDPELYFERR